MRAIVAPAPLSRSQSVSCHGHFSPPRLKRETSDLPGFLRSIHGGSTPCLSLANSGKVRIDNARNAVSKASHENVGGEGVEGVIEPAGVEDKRPRAKRSANDFIFGKIIGEGSFSTVYLAKDVHTKKEYAIKVCNKQLIIREKKWKDVGRERDVMIILNKKTLPSAPFFVKMFSYFQDPTRLFFELSYAQNGDLLSLIQKLGRFDENCTKFYAGEILHALEHMHSLGIVHRDLKPENILLNAKMHMVISDFGCAKSILEESEPITTPQRSSFVGTAHYIAPELLKDGDSSRACDLWAYGAIVYQMVAGVPPFRGGSEWNIFGLIKELKYNFPEEFNPVAKDLVQKFLVLEPEERLGARDGDRYTSIREHPFFEGVELESLHLEVPPVTPFLAGFSHLQESKDNYQIPSNLEPGLSDKQMNRLLGLDLGQSPTPTQRRQRSLLGLNSLTDREIERRLIEQIATVPCWHSLCEGNLILKRGHIYKKRHLFSRKRMLLLTLGPHLYYVDSDTMTLKGEIPWSPELRVECKSFKIFFVHTPNRTYYLQDPEGYALEWMKAIEEVRLRMYGSLTQ